VWLEEADKSQATPAKPVAGDRKPGTPSDTASGRRPKHLEAIGNVVSRSRDLNIHDTSRLVVWFKDVPPQTHLPPGAAPPPSSAPANRATNQPVDSRPAGASQPARAQAAGAAQAKPTPSRALPNGPEQQQPQTSKSANAPESGPRLAPADNRPPARPFDLSARSVEAKVLRSTIKSSVDELWCEGSVAVKQDPAKAEEKGTDIKGDTLKMTARSLDSYLLVVTGDLAELQTDKIYIIGPEVNIDQLTNKAWVYGDGAMKMDSATNFQGDKLAKPVPLTVHWSRSMLFNGASAEYHGNIQAVQENARLACQRLHAFFDRTISLKEGNKSDQPAKVRELVCDRDVRIEDSEYDGDKLVKWRLLNSSGVQMVALDPEEDDPDAPGRTRAPAKPAPGKEDPNKASAGNVVYASGPGNVRMWEPGDNDLGAPGGKGAAAKTTAAKPAAPPAKGKQGKKASSDDMRLTYVEFQKRMDANSKTKTALFWENVRVLNLPCKKPDTPIDLDTILADDLPEGAMYLRCDRLKVLDHPTDGAPNKQMEAHGKVYVQGREFYARSDWATFNQQKQQVIFYGGDGYATLYKVDVPGGKPTVLEGKKIIHNRSTGKTEVYGAREVSGESLPSGSKQPAPKPGQPRATPPRPR
jgi:hypothetical protein